MKLYRNAEGKWVGTQAEAGNKNIIEVPVDKPSLLEWLNANCGTAQEHRPNADIHSDGPSVHRSASDVQKVACEKCKFTPELQRNYVQRVIKGLDFEALEQRIEQLDGWDIGRVLSIVLNRASDLCKSLLNAQTSKSISDDPSENG